MHSNAALSFFAYENKLKSLAETWQKFVLPQETRERQNKSRWELIQETLKKKLTNPHELKASFTSVSFFCQDLMYFTS